MSTALVILLVVGGTALILACVVHFWPERSTISTQTELRSQTVVNLPPGPPRVLLAVDAPQLAQLYFGSLPDVPELLLAVDESIRSTGGAKGDAAGISAGVEHEDSRAVHRELASKEEDPGRRSRAFEHFTGPQLPTLDLRPDDSYDEYRRRVRDTLAAAGRDVDALVDDAMEHAWRSERVARNAAERPSLRRLSGTVKIAARWTVVSAPDDAQPDRELELRTTTTDVDRAWEVSATTRGHDVAARWHKLVTPGARITAAVVGVIIDGAASGQRHVSIFYCHFD